MQGRDDKKGMTKCRLLPARSARNTKGYSSTAASLGTRPNISESHSEISTRVPFCIAGSLTFSCKRAADWTTRFFFVELIANGITKGEDRQLTWGETCVAGLGGGTMSAIATV